MGGQRVRDAIRSDLGRVVDAQPDAGLHPGPDDDGPAGHVPVGEADECLGERRHDATQDERVHRLERQVFLAEQGVERHGELIFGPVVIRGGAPGRDELVTAIRADDDVRVARVDREERPHG